MFVNPEQLPIQDDDLVWVNEPVMRYLVYTCHFPVMSFRTKKYAFRKTPKLKESLDKMPLLTKLQGLT